MKKAIKKDKKFIRDGFDGIAAKYDFFNNFITFGQHRRIKKELAKNTIQKIFTHTEPCQILDICCGTGDITHQLENFTPKNYEIIGMDFSSEMLKIAKGRKKNSNIKFILKDVLPIPFARNSLTAITVGFGLRNLTDLDFGLKEIYRCLKKGGVFACLDMGKVTSPIASPIFRLFFFKLVSIRVGFFFKIKTSLLAYFCLGRLKKIQALTIIAKKKIQKKSPKKAPAELLLSPLLCLKQ